MRLPLRLWKRTLATLGLVIAEAPRRKRPIAALRHRPLRVEQLEPLVMLAMEVSVFPVQAEYNEDVMPEFRFVNSQPAPQPFAIEYEVSGGPAGPYRVTLHFSKGATGATVPIETADNATPGDGYALNIVVKSTTEISPPGPSGTFGAATTRVLDNDAVDHYSIDAAFAESSFFDPTGPTSVTLNHPGDATEGTPFELTGTISPPGYYSFGWEVNYGFGEFSHNPETGEFSVMVLISDDDGGENEPTPSDPATIVMSVWESGTPPENGPSGQTTITVHNADPTFFDPSSGALLIDVYEQPLGGPSLYIVGTFFDAGVVDTHTVTIDWGDGSQPTVFVPQNRQINASHNYAADGGNYVVSITASDDDTGVGGHSVLFDMYLLDLDNDADNDGQIDAEATRSNHSHRGSCYFATTTTTTRTASQT